MSTNIVDRPRKIAKNYLHIRLTTWHKNSHQLFDYSEENLAKTSREYEIPVNKTNHFFILRDDKDHYSILEMKQNSVDKLLTRTTSLNIIAKIIIQPNLISKKLELCFEKVMPTDLNVTATRNKIIHESPNLVVSGQKDSKQNPRGCLLQVGSVVCFGRLKYLVRELKINGNLETFDHFEELRAKCLEERQENQSGDSDQQIIKDEVSNSPVKIEQKQQKKQEQEPEEQRCRICFDVDSPTDRLISVCKCTGSCKYSHFKCLKHWVEMKIVVSDREYCTSIQKIDCEICKAEIPMTVSLDGNTKQVLVLASRPQGCDYVMLEKMQGRQKNILIIKNPPYEGVSVGRDASSYIRINDISVSRVHAFIKYNKGQFYIYDNKSKFGTLVRLQPAKIEIGKYERSMQIGRTLMDVVVKPHNHLLQGI